MYDSFSIATSGRLLARFINIIIKNYADLYYCNVYHNCHGGFDTVQYCANGLVWRQDSSFGGTCDWPVNSKIVNGVECGDKKM